jgi:tetratricopeptide (TPR) repeat protein
MTTPADAPTEPGGEAWFGEGDNAIGLGARLGRYELVRLVGMGGMGVVFEARDPELDRTVAVKVLRERGLGTAGEARLRREGQTMARLTHPNVIRVYDVGVSRDHVFVAMEFVRGGTLADWLARGTRTPAEIIAVFVQAGRGLAAAHDAGLVHRDFKPTNVLVGDDGRVLVTDFGLARQSGDSMPPTVPGGGPTIERAAPNLTQTGHFVGTPGYMAPEQYSGGLVDGRADQFGFCVSLWRGLFSSAPYAGSTVDEMVSAAMKLAIVEPPVGSASRAPPRIRAALQRGLDPDPSKRFPSMHALLAMLEPRPSRRWVWIAGAAGAAAIAAVVIAATRDNNHTTAPTTDPCPAPDAEIAKLWNITRRTALRDHLTRVDPATGAQRFAAAAEIFDYNLAQWRDTHVAACRATRVDGKQSDSLLDARMGCLRDWLVQIGGIATDLENAADPKQVESTIKSVSTIAPLSRCSDSNAMLARSQFPVAPEARAESDAIQREGMAINKARKGGNVEALVERTNRLVERARKLGNPATLTKAIGMRWRIAVMVGDVDGAIELLREVTEIAARAHDDTEAANAWSVMARLTAQYKGQPDEAKVMVSAARAAAARAGDPPELLADVLIVEGDVLNMARDDEGALRAAETARSLLVEIGAGRPGSSLGPKLADVSQTISTIHWFADRLDRSIPLLQEAKAIWDRAYGPDTVESSGALLDLAQILSQRGEYEAALIAARDGVRIREERTGRSQVLALGLLIQAEVEHAADRVDDAIGTAERALAIARDTMSPDAVQTEEIRIAGIYGTAGRYREALAIYQRALAAFDKSGMKTINVPMWWVELGMIERELGQCKDAIVHFRKAAAIARELEGDESAYAGRAIRAEGECHYVLGRTRDAIATLERGLSFRIPPQGVVEAAVSRGILGMLRGDAALVREALATIAPQRSSRRYAKDRRLAALDAWIARRK